MQPPSDPLSQEYLYSTDRLLTVGKGNPVFVKRMLTVFVQQMNETMEQLNTSIHNPDQVYIILHQVKPAVSEICHPSMTQLIDHIQSLAKLHYTAEMIAQVQVFLTKVEHVTHAISHAELTGK